MDPEKNRAFENLLLLCKEDHTLVDDYPDLFPAETLREWKKLQIEDCDQLGYKPYESMSDSEIKEIQRRSIESEEVRSDALLRLVRCVEKLRQGSVTARTKPAAVAAAWGLASDRVRNSFFAYDDQGERAYAELSWSDADHYRSMLKAALSEASLEVSAVALAAKVELAAVRVSHSGLGEYCDWVADTIDTVEATSRTWPEPPPFDDGEQFSESVTGLGIAVNALIQAIAGELTPVPPRVVESDLLAEDQPDSLAQHCDLLERARPFSRVRHRAYDPDLRSELAFSTAFAASLPELPQTLSFGLMATSGLATAVAKNASTEELLRLVSSDQLQLPLCAAVSLLAETYREFHGTEKSEVAVEARSAIVQLVEGCDWSTGESWKGNELHGNLVFGVLASLTSADAVRDLLTAAIDREPERISALVLSCATWFEDREQRPPYGLRAIGRRYRSLPEWFPAQKVLSLAESTTDSSLADAQQKEIGQLLEQIAEICRGRPNAN